MESMSPLMVVSCGLSRAVHLLARSYLILYFVLIANILLMMSAAVQPMVMDWMERNLSILAMLNTFALLGSYYYIAKLQAHA